MLVFCYTGIYIFLIMCCVADENIQRCQQISCGGHRPMLDDGCCPVVAWNECSNANSCDSELGYVCEDENGQPITDGVGICKGKHRLRLLDTQEKEITIEWEDFAPSTYLYEYVVLLREDQFAESVADWEQRDIGDEPRYTIKRLKPATLYFIKIAIYEDIRAAILTNISETLIAQTKGVSSCEHNEELVPVGDSIVQPCEDNCTCQPTGLFDCQPVCPEQNYQEPTVLCERVASNSCCNVTIACPIGAESCEMDGIQYDHGAIWEQDCRTCSCHNGHLQCTYPGYCRVMEPSSSCPHPQSFQVEGQCCPEWDCGLRCTLDVVTYRIGEYFTSPECGLCQCLETGEVTCSADCPPVEIPTHGDSACPDPHIKTNGCCDTLYCSENNLDSNFFRRMFANSYSPVTLTLSFEVESYEVDGVPHYCLYEVFYTNSSSSSGHWNHQRVQPVDIYIQRDQNKINGLDDALTTQMAVVVDGRVFVTLSGMTPNTTYYVRIVTLNQHFHEMDDYNVDRNMINKVAMLAVKTRPLDNATSCFHIGKEFRHGNEVTRNCSKLCRCIMGRVKCQSLCSEENMVVAVSPSCPQPRLEKKEGICCPVWRCYPKASDCSFMGLTLATDQSITTGCSVCTCVNSTVTCRSVCPPITEAITEGCQLVNISGQCCQQWQCKKERRPPIAIEIKLYLHFPNICKTKYHNLNLREQLKEKITNKAKEKLNCDQENFQFADFCSNITAQIVCSEHNAKKREKRSILEDRSLSNVFLILRLNLGPGVDKEKTKNLALTFGLYIQKQLTSGVVVVVEGKEFISDENPTLTDVVYTCDRNFELMGSSCVLSEIEFEPIKQQKTSFTAKEVQANYVILEWSALDQELYIGITEVYIYYRSKGSSNWLISEKLSPNVVSWRLSTNPNTEYEARLVGRTIWQGDSQRQLGQTTFVTQLYAEEFYLPLEAISITGKIAVLYWPPIHGQTVSNTSVVNILYKQSDQTEYSHKVRVENETHGKLTGLKADTNYTVKIFVLLSPNREISSREVHFTTSSESSERQLLLVCLLATSCLAILVVVAGVICILWNKTRKQHDHLSFDNKTYQADVEKETESSVVAETAEANIHSSGQD